MLSMERQKKAQAMEQGSSMARFPELPESHLSKTMVIRDIKHVRKLLLPGMQREQRLVTLLADITIDRCGK